MEFLEISPTIQNALDEDLPIVALESTIISHGMPFPKNVETALQVEDVVRENGAIPATIAIIQGKMKVGLTHEEIQYLGKKGQAAYKTSRRDIPYLIAKKLDGATTVAATMIIAEKANIPVFATGGIGGVHRGATRSMDISADLQELANTKVVVVSAGAKAILNLKLTLEYLETFGVPVVGFQTDQFPAFYTRYSDLKVDFNLSTPTEIANFITAKWAIGLKGGILIANPIPQEAEMKYQTIQNAIEKAIEKAISKGITGKSITPFLLKTIVELTGGESLQANIELVKNNAKLASKIAIELRQK